MRDATSGQRAIRRESVCPTRLRGDVITRFSGRARARIPNSDTHSPFRCIFRWRIRVVESRENASLHIADSLEYAFALVCVCSCVEYRH